jgi:putative transposase
VTDLVLKTFSYRVKDATSGKRLTTLANAVNTVWNYANEISARSAERGALWATKKQLRELTKGSGKLVGLPSQVVQEVIDEFLIKRKAARRPKLRWRASRGPKRALGWVPFTNQDIVLDGATAVLRGAPFRLWLHRAAEGRIKSGNFSQDARGRWYCNLVCEVERGPRRGRGRSRAEVGSEVLGRSGAGTGPVLPRP